MKKLLTTCPTGRQAHYLPDRQAGSPLTSRGFSIIEIVLTTTIVAVLIGISIGIYSVLQNRSSLDVDAQKIISALRLAHSRTLASENTASHGVHFESTDNSFVNFEGVVYNSLDPNNKVTFLNDRIEFLNVQLAGGAVDTVFSRISGQTIQDGFIEIADASDNTEARTICIEATGVLRILDPQDENTSCNPSAMEYVDGLVDGDLASFPSNSGFGDPAQSFTAGSSDTDASSIELYVRRFGTPSDVFLEIRDTSTVGNVVGKSLLVEGSTLPSSLSWVKFEFPNPVVLSSSTQYFMRLRSLPTSNVAFSGASGTVIWGYEHSAISPPAYSGGDAWRYIGANNVSSDQGQQLGPADQYDFSFKIFDKNGPTNIDSRILEFDLGFSLRDSTTIELSFDGGSVVQNITVATYMNAGSTEFNWTGTVLVGGEDQIIEIHSLYIDDQDTVLHIHRDRDLNNVALGVDIDSTDLVDYTVGGVATKGSIIDSMIYR